MARKNGLGQYGIGRLAQVERSVVDVMDRLETVNKSVANLKAVKTVKAKSKYRGNRPITKTTTKSVIMERGHWTITKPSNKKAKKIEFEDVIRYVIEDATQSLRGKGRTWAIETLQMMKALAPVRTENLMDSIKIASNDKAMKSAFSNRLEANGMLYVVGVDTKALLPPPKKKHVKHGKLTGKMVTMPDYVYVSDADEAIKRLKGKGYRGYDFLRRWQRVAKENMERIFK